MFFIISAVIGVWCVGLARYCWHFSVFETSVFALSLAGVWVAAFFVGRAGWMLAAVEFCALLSFFMLTPERRFGSEKWNIECRRIPQITRLSDGRIKIADVRDFRYRTPEDFDVNYREVVIDPEKLDSMDVIFSSWMSIDAVAHMLLRFNFSDAGSLAVSFEPRVPLGLRGGCFFPGIYRQYGQMMLFAVPEDIVDLRTHYRKETVYSFRSAAGKAVVKKIFMEVAAHAEKLMKNYAFYNSVTGNCTTGLLPAFRHFPALEKNDIRCLFNGYYDRFLFEKGFLKHAEGETFASLKARSLLKSCGNY